MDNAAVKVYPWQEQPWSLVQSMIARDRLPHALLLSGVKGTGLFEFAVNLANGLLCEQPTDAGYQCESCTSCHLLKAATHPDLLIVEPEEEGKAIKIDQIRSLVSYSQLQSHAGQSKVIIIHPAEAMNTSSANSLLKTLEEPPGDTVIILVSQQPSMLPITVRSRCQKVKISANRDQVKSWLVDKTDSANIETVLASGCGPLFYDSLVDTEKSVDRVELLGVLESLASKQADPIDTAEAWSKGHTQDTLFWLLKIIQDILKLTASDTKTDVTLVNDDLRQQLTVLATQFEIKGFFLIYDKLLEYHRLVAGNTSVKPVTMFEDVTVEWNNLRRLQNGSNSK